ncbi:hypothetical protein EUX57_02955 [Pseudomonas orientalis]|uniref:Uncharacterized protein n=1 Tax=Pseudomonas orientalis TaxID=76758 RepID=A0A4Q7D2U3_9PSED|nr:hypothetical protein EUX57_02955 [Pseudomonas orientalis]
MGKSILLSFALFKSEPPSGRNPKQPLPQQRICTRSAPRYWLALRPPSGASPLPHLHRDRHKIPVGSKAAALLFLISGAPLNHAGRTQA